MSLKNDLIVAEEAPETEDVYSLLEALLYTLEGITGSIKCYKND